MKSITIIKELGLKKYLNILIESNPSNLAPYHNLYHTLCVIENCYDIYNSLQIRNEPLKELIIAAIFHDFNHSAGLKSDEINVQRAIRSFLDSSYESVEFNSSVVSIIKSTQYPYVLAEEDLNLSQKIIRDADLLQILRDNYLSQNILGLMSEFNVHGVVHSYTDILLGTLKFMNGIKFHTKYADNLFKSEYPKIKLEIEYLINN